MPMPFATDSPNKATFRRFLDASNSGDLVLLRKTIDDVFEPDATIRTPVPLQTSGAEAMKEVFTTLHRAYPDLHVEVEDMVEEGDRVAVRNTVTGTHRGAYMGLPPTGKSVVYNEMFMLRFVNGRIAETWGVVDVLAQLRQLGALRT
jgi:steroid delta-isomerase-like uncharacterized protein